MESLGESRFVCDNRRADSTVVQYGKGQLLYRGRNQVSDAVRYPVAEDPMFRGPGFLIALFANAGLEGGSGMSGHPE